MIRITTPLLLLAFLPGMAAADASLECNDAGSQVEIGACVEATSKRVEAALTFALSVAQASAAELDTVTGRVEAAPALEAAQAAWAAYRDAQCAYIGSTFGGGSGTGIAIASCRIDLARARTEVLLREAR